MYLAETGVKKDRMESKDISRKFETRIARLKHIPTGRQQPIPLISLLAIYALSVVTSLSGLAVSPILGDLQTVFPHASELEIQMLTSLPALVIVPFVLIAGKLSLKFDQKKLAIWGLAIYSASSVIYMLVTGSLGLMLANSVLLGIGAGLVIPLSTGMVADNFSGAYRTKQLGIASAIANLSLVLATMLAGWLAGIDWHYSFLVYFFSVVALAFAFKLPDNKSHVPDPAANDPSLARRGVRELHIFGKVIRLDWPLEIMQYYFWITIIALVVPLNLSIYMDKFSIGGTGASGTLISAFFLAIMLPGLFINRIISGVPQKNNLVALGAMLLGLLLMLFHSLWLITIGVLLVGAGYGIMQPLVYDRTSNSVAPKRVTFALALVMAMNYSAIILSPFLQRLAELIVRTDSVYMPFGMSILICLILFWPQYRYVKRLRDKRTTAAESRPGSKG